MTGITVALTGASGIQYGMRLLECLLAAEREVHLVVSEAARVVAGLETDWQLPGRPTEIKRALRERLGDGGRLRVYGQSQWTAPLASGSGAPSDMVICPCTTGTLAAIATGSSDNLIERAADVVLKERGRLVLVVRETPLSEVHLRNMLRLARLGAVILPASPGFYHRPEGIADLVDFVVARTLDHLGVAHDLLPRWGQGD